jgi:hypothetical protein
VHVGSAGRADAGQHNDPYALDLGPLHEHRTAVSGNSGIPVSVPVVVADAVSFVGDARHRGDILTVTGVFHRAHPADGGGPTIQAWAARITQPGRVTARPLDRARALVATSLSIAVLLATRIARQRRPLRPRAR